ncbi:5-Enolpyruvylshikimate-3-phosphate synthase [hydrothermal vent metagenome]|uniref:3-phosphoshikimate 1-carboxyvinyltransferase n=1 Tax=hydrothermal vent metagenome TaxID=652676 RepID=A0A1W1BNU5_9ZZZZ
MKSISIQQCSKPFNLECLDIAPDKSISHRCAIFSLLSNQTSTIKNFLLGEDTLSSLSIAQQLGATVTRDVGNVTITPPSKLSEPFDVLDCGNAGTGMRLYAGLLAGIEGLSVLTGDKYLRSRPMNRVTVPLRNIGAKIDGREDGNLAPLAIRGAKLKSFKYHSPIDSAQVKSALILAGLQADEKSYYKEDLLSRDHTERMLRGMGAKIKTDDNGWIEIEPLTKPLNPLNITIPADPSSGFFFAVASAITPNSKTIIKNVTLNPTRIEAYKILQKMGAKISFIEKENLYEPIGDIEISYNGKLSAVKVEKNIAWLIDELPALAIAMAVAEGRSLVTNAKELRVKESDRISTLLEGLANCGITTLEYEDGYEIIGSTLKSATINSYGDHRIAMSFAIAGIVCSMKIEDIECIDTSFPNFFEILQNITQLG